MSSKKFWKLTFYEWSIWVERIKLAQERRKQDRELLIELERNTMALMANIHKGKNTEVFSGRDFYKLSYDEVVESSKVTGQQMYQALLERFKDKPIKKRG